MEYGKGDSLYLVPTKKLEHYRALNPINQYMLLLKTYWTKLDFAELYYDSMSMSHPYMYTKLAFEELSHAEPGVRVFADVENFQECYDVNNPLHRFFVCAGLVVAHLSTFGFWGYEEAIIPHRTQTKKDIDVKAITPTRLGVAMIQALRKRPYELYHEDLSEEYIIKQWRESSFVQMIEKLGLKRPQSNFLRGSFEDVFAELFVPGALEPHAINRVLGEENPAASGSMKGNVFVFKVSLSKKTWRKITISTSHSLEHLHRSILEAFELDEDHLSAFFMDGRAWSKSAYWAREMGREPSTHDAILKSLGLFPGQRFLYLYDFGDELRFMVELLEVQETKTIPLRGQVIEKRG